MTDRREACIRKVIMMKERYGLIGRNLIHSFSADYFNKKFLREGLDACYDLFPISSIDKIMSIIENIPELKGINITIPYKEAIMPYLSFVSGEAKECGAVNVVKVNRNIGGIYLSGFNTDIIGFMNALMPILEPRHKNALVFGTGGAAKAVKYALEKLEIDYTVVSRKKECGDMVYSDINKGTIRAHTILINATPLGTYPDVGSAVDIPYDFVTQNHIAFDLVYNPSETSFLRQCRLHGAKCKNGLEMLHIQAEEAWKIWNHG